MLKLNLIHVVLKRLIWVATFFVRIQIIDPIVKAKERKAGFHGEATNRSVEWKLASANFHADYNIARISR